MDRLLSSKHDIRDDRPEQQFLFDRQLLQQRRQRIAARIADHDFLLARLTDDFTDRLTLIKRQFPTAVNLGAHNGLLSRRLRILPQVGMMIDVDPCAAMLAQCDGPSLRADEELLPFANGSLDLIASGLTLQWVNDLPGALAQMRRALKPDGLLLAGLIGGMSLHELRDCMIRAEQQVEGGASPRIAPFADLRALGSLLQRAGFALPVADTDVVEVSYDNALALMHDLRLMGAGNVMTARRRKPLRRQTLFRTAEIYAGRYGRADGRISATFEIITLTGWAPHESQQQPLRPGSAKARLADALGVSEVSAGDKAAGGSSGG